MKLSNQNIYNLRGCKNFWGRCQMPLVGGGVQIISGGGVCTPRPPENPCLLERHLCYQSLVFLALKKGLKMRKYKAKMILLSESFSVPLILTLTCFIVASPQYITVI
jgi:hypothetical protein